MDWTESAWPVIITLLLHTCGNAATSVGKEGMKQYMGRDQLLRASGVAPDLIFDIHSWCTALCILRSCKMRGSSAEKKEQGLKSDAPKSELDLSLGRWLHCSVPISPFKVGTSIGLLQRLHREASSVHAHSRFSMDGAALASRPSTRSWSVGWGSMAGDEAFWGIHSLLWGM